ncbi:MULTISPECIES: LysR substrate-binding domain-containing protein [unclassified Ensifer]|uniref:LysR substrate-binding domain-containing protein n=1 Tax=unclassified Ensifer TaxID=2633371 RepID=UPI000812E705|nr:MULTISPECIES: LysR substrate-binding domain-containing protein [unclassified Ensifer]OCP05811.1 LysR family transcriptional regulator [Ensifer sp. LC11]OCP06556.1 LysR family transcriptional regulator [Ensifer sp. LC13]OCP06718.1 LysR family transcriptional regulator [Ensifer sp. LC14]OCP31204.1 LysR family transcriptional regulator [Ensifer sp. LC499]
MYDLNDLYYFVQVVEHGGFAAAARATGTQKSRLSRRIAILEERIGVRLIQRSPRRFFVTDVGREYYQRCVAVLIEAEAADAFIAQHQGEPQGVIKVSCPTALISFQFGRLFARFMTTYPKIGLQLESTNRRVDVIAEGFDVSIRVRFPPLEKSELVMRKLDDSSQYLVARPGFIKAPLQAPEQLAGLASLAWTSATNTYEWRLERTSGERTAVRHEPRFLTDDMAALREAALDGAGIVQLPTMMIWKDLAAGTLVPVLPEWRPASGVVHAVFPSRRGLLPSVRTFIDFLVQECAAERLAIDRSLA